MATPTPPPPGWYPDPHGGPHQRYWDGNQWQPPASSARHRRVPESVTIEEPQAWVDEQRAEQQLAATKLAQITPPADAVRTSDWEKHHETWSRTFEGAAQKIHGIEVGIIGTQRADGSVTRRVMIREGDAVRLPRLVFGPVPDAGLTADTARKLAAAITQTAEEVDRLA